MTAPPWELVLATGSADQTRRLAAALSRCCRPGDVVLLVGDLGTGKTTFAQGFAEGLGVAGPVTSPTFTLVRQYPVPGTGPRSGPVRQLVHADVYRLSSLAEMEDLGLAELVEDGAIGLVEWGERAAPVLGPDHVVVALAADRVPEEPDHRALRVQAVGPAWAGRADEVARALAGFAPEGPGGPG